MRGFRKNTGARAQGGRCMQRALSGIGAYPAFDRECTDRIGW